MKVYIVIPAHNEGAFLEGALAAICQQTQKPSQVVVVNDHSTDNTQAIAANFSSKYPFIKAIEHRSSDLHMPGSKVVNAFNVGLSHLDNNYDLLLKLDADIILPSNYLEVIINHFRSRPKLGICGGFAYEQDKDGHWLLNHPMDKNHIRGAFKTYSKACFIAMSGLRAAMGWDTVDELLAQYNGFELMTDPKLHVKHLRPIGAAYNKKAKLLQGKAMFTMRYGLMISAIAALKIAVKQRKPKAFFHCIRGFIKARLKNENYLVTKQEGIFIRGLRLRNIRSKLFGISHS